MIDWNGFDNGVIEKKLPSDTTLNNMRKADLIELLHIADHNHKVLAEAYRIAVDNSKYNTCPLGCQKDVVGEQEKIITELEKAKKIIIGRYDSSVPLSEMPSYKIAYNNGIDKAIEIVKGK